MVQLQLCLYRVKDSCRSYLQPRQHKVKAVHPGGQAGAAGGGLEAELEERYLQHRSEFYLKVRAREETGDRYT